MSTESLSATAAQAAFNDLRLPVIWVNDTERPGTLEKDELYVHPSFWAVNAVLAAEGKEPISVEAIVEAGMKYVSTPKGQRVAHPLLMKDLASRAEPFMEFNIEGITNRAVAGATRLAVQIAGLADVYHRTQVEPNYLEQFRAVVASGDAVAIHHFFLRGWIGCIDKETAPNPLDCNPVPGGTRTKNGVWYPADWTEKDLVFLREHYPWPTPELKRMAFSPHSRIVEKPARPVCEDRSFTYQGQEYQVQSLTSVERLRVVGGLMAAQYDEAARVIQRSDAAFARMLRSQATYLRSPAVFADRATDELWVKTDHANLTLVAARTETYGMFGSPFEDKATMQGTVAFNDPVLSKFLGGVAKKIPAMERALAELWTSRGHTPPFDFKPKPIPPLRYVHLIFGGGIGNSVDYVGGGFILPNSGHYETDVPADKMHHRIILYGTIMASRVEGQGLPVARVLFDDEAILGLEAVVRDPLGMALFANAHENAHATGVHVSEDLYGLWHSGGSNHAIAAGFEEGKADASGLFYLPRYVDLGLMTPEQKTIAYYAYFGNLLRNLFLLNDTHGLGAAYHWQLLTQPHYGVVVKGADGPYRFDWKRLEQMMPDFVKEYQDLMASRDLSRVRAFHDEALSNVGAETDIGRAVTRAKAAGGPKMHRPYYVVYGYETR